MAEMQGASIADLRDFARAVGNGAQQVDGIRRWMTAIPRHVWKGADAEDFLNRVDTDLVVRLGQVTQALERVANAVKVHADQQEDASAAHGGFDVGPGGQGDHMWAGAIGLGPGAGVSVGSAVGASPLARDFGSDLGVLSDAAVDGVDNGLDVAELRHVKLPQVFDALDRVLMVRGLADGTAEFTEGAGDGDISLMLNGGLKVGLEALGLIPPLKPIAAVGSLAQSMVEFSLPIGGDQIDTVLESHCQRTYGASADSLTPGQASELSQRYNGIGGFVNLVGDTWKKNTDELLNAGGGLMGAIGGFFGGGR